MERVNWMESRECSDVTQKVFCENDGQAATNENTFVMAIAPSSITLYQDGQRYPKFDLAKAKTYLVKVNDKLARLVQDTIKKWDAADYDCRLLRLRSGQALLTVDLSDKP